LKLRSFLLATLAVCLGLPCAAAAAPDETPRPSITPRNKDKLVNAVTRARGMSRDEEVRRAETAGGHVTRVGLLEIYDKHKHSVILLPDSAKLRRTKHNLIVTLGNRERLYSADAVVKKAGQALMIEYSGDR
jgi:hypothetical protein